MQVSESRRCLFALGAIVLLGFGMRAVQLSDRYFWYDEALILNVDRIWQPAPVFVDGIWNDTTYNPGWPLIVWGAIHTFGDSLFVARMPSCIAGTLTILALYWASRALRLDRRVGLLAALLGAVSVNYVAYSCQILPYAAVPLLSTVTIALLAELERARRLRRLVYLHLALIVCFAVSVSIHNSFLLITPVIALSLVAIDLMPRRNAVFGTEADAGPPAEGTAQISAGLDLTARLVCVCGTLAIIALLAAYFYYPKQGEGFRDYLSSYYLPTFRRNTSNIKAIVRQVDTWYLAHSPHRGPHQWNWVDAAYFAVTRTADALTESLTVWYSRLSEPWQFCATSPLIVLFLVGVRRLVRDRGERPAILLLTAIVVGGLTAIMLSVAMMYPFGGVRQMLPLAPLVTIVTAIGARRFFSWSPRLAGSSTVVVLASVLALLPAQIQDTKSVLSRADMQTIVLQGGAQNLIVAGDWSYGPLKYYFRSVRRVRVLPALGNVGEAVRNREPFVVLALSTIAPFRRTPDGLRATPEFCEHWGRRPDLRSYEIEPLVMKTWSGEPRFFSYSVRPRLPAAAAQLDGPRRRY